jgi:F-type H+-transporting ATPase subunit b
MSLVLLAAASPSAESAHAASQGGNPLELLQKFGVEWNYVAWQLVSYAILAFVLYRFAIKPVLATMDERNRKIEEGLKHAEDTKAQLAAAKQESEALLRKAQQDAGKVIDEARKTAKEFADREAAAATERANGLIAKAQQAIELEHRKMLDEARGEIARLVVSTTQRVLAKELSDAERARYNEAAARELTQV